MLKNAKGFLAGFLCCIVVLTFCIPTFAAPVEKMVKAFYNDIKILINGTELIPKDVSGKKVEPFVLDGTTYLPVRAIGEAFGMKVDWDSATQSVILGGVPKLSVQGNSKIFEDSFINKPLDEKWTKTGVITFDKENGLNFSYNFKGTTLILEGISIEESNDFSVEFEALQKVFNTYLFVVSLGVDKDGKQTETLSSRASKIKYNGNDIATSTIKNDTWYKVRIDVINKQVNIYINDELIASQKLDGAVKQQFALGTDTSADIDFNIKNFKITIKD